MILKPDMQHRGLEFYKVYINDDPGFTLTYFTVRSNLVTYTFELGKSVTKSFKGENFQQWAKLNE